MRLALAFAIVARLALSQALPESQAKPEPQALLDRAQATALSFHSLQFVIAVTMETQFPGAPIKVNTEIASAYLNPGKIRMETKTAGMTFLDVSDGETTWLYSSVTRQYTKIPAAQGPAAIMSSIGVMMPDLADVHTSYQPVREETVEIDGARHDCWVVTMNIGQMALPAADQKNQPKMTGATMSWWIDKKLMLDLKMDLAMTMEIGAKPVTMHQTMTKTKLTVDQPLAEALFTFMPPAGSAQVEKLKLFGTTAGAKPELAGKRAPAFALKSMDGKTFDLETLKGKPVLLDFWATWCEPCRESMPALEKIARESKAGDLVILGVNSGEGREIVEKFLQKTPFGYPAVLSGESGILASYQVTAYPTFIMIGRDGKIVANEIGFHGEEQLREMIAKAK